MIVKAILEGRVKQEFNVRSSLDRRKKCDRYVYSYRYGAYEWRRSIETPVGIGIRPEEFIKVWIAVE